MLPLNEPNWSISKQAKYNEIDCYSSEIVQFRCIWTFISEENWKLVQKSIETIVYRLSTLSARCQSGESLLTIQQRANFAALLSTTCPNMNTEIRYALFYTIPFEGYSAAKTQTFNKTEP